MIIWSCVPALATTSSRARHELELVSEFASQDKIGQSDPESFHKLISLRFS